MSHKVSHIAVRGRGKETWRLKSQGETLYFSAPFHLCEALTDPVCFCYSKKDRSVCKYSSRISIHGARNGPAHTANSIAYKARYMKGKA